MDKSIQYRLERLERVVPAPEVALLISQPSGLWEMIRSGKQQRRSVHKDIDAAKRRLQAESTLIIVDV